MVKPIPLHLRTIRTRHAVFRQIVPDAVFYSRIVSESRKWWSGDNGAPITFVVKWTANVVGVISQAQSAAKPPELK